MAKITSVNINSRKALQQLLGAILDDLTNLKTVVDELHDDHATIKTLETDVKTLSNSLQTWFTAFPTGNPGLQIDTNFDVNNANAIDYCISGALYTLSATTTCDTGTNKQADAGNWAIMLISADTGGSLTATWANNSGAGYSSEANAIAAMPSVPADECPIGYVTVQADGANTFTAGTDALQGGAGGNPAQTTNYNDEIDAVAAVGASVTSSPPASLSASKSTLNLE